MLQSKWITAKFIVTDCHELAAAAWGKALDAVLAELLKLEDEAQAGISINFIALYKRLGQLDFCTLDEFRQMVDQLLNEHGELCDASDGQSGAEPLCLTPKGREMARSRWETARTCSGESGS